MRRNSLFSSFVSITYFPQRYAEWNSWYRSHVGSVCALDDSMRAYDRLQNNLFYYYYPTTEKLKQMIIDFITKIPNESD